MAVKKNISIYGSKRRNCDFYARGYLQSILNSECSKDVCAKQLNN